MKKLLFATLSLVCAAGCHAGIPEVVGGVEAFVMTAPDEQTGLFVLHGSEDGCLYFGGAHLSQREPHSLREHLWALGRGERTLPAWHLAVTRQACRDGKGEFRPKAVDYEWDQDLLPLRAHDHVVLREVGSTVQPAQLEQ